MSAKIFLVAILCAQCYVIQAVTEEDLKVQFTRYAVRCTKEHPVEVSDLVQLQKYILPKKSEVACLLACAYKLGGVINAQGKLDIEKSYSIVETLKNGDEQRLINGKKFVDECSKVNDIEVSDGEKGCERAAMLFKCGIENITKYGFKLV